MAEGCKKVVLRFACLLRCDFFCFKLAAPNLVGDVACDFGETANLPGVITKRGYDYLRFERRSVLADAQTLITNVSAARGFAEVALRFSGGNVIRRIEGGEVFADDLLSRVTFDFLRTGVPGDDIAVGVQQVDGVLFDAIYQDMELLGGLVQFGVAWQLLKHRL